MQTETAKDPYVKVEGAAGQQESIPAPALIGAAYGAIWLIVLAFVWSVLSRSRRLEEEIASLERRLDEKRP